MAAALSWPISHAENRVTPSIRSALTRTIYEFATHTPYLHAPDSALTFLRISAHGGGLIN
jgi:hypothetical protein